MADLIHWATAASFFVGFARLGFASEQLFYRVVSTQESRVTAFSADGYLTWSNSVSDAGCRIEWCENLCEMSTNSVQSPEIKGCELVMNVKVPMAPVKDPAVLSIYSDGWGRLLETWVIENGEPLQVYIEEEYPYYDPPLYYAYAHQENAYTELYYFASNKVFTVEKDAVPGTPWTMTGVIFGRQVFFRDHYLARNRVDVTGPRGPLPSIQTDEAGRYLITNQIPGEYTLSFTYEEFPFSFTITNTPLADYQDLYFNDPYQAAAPNIYLYPEVNTNVSVSVTFPSGGHVTVSEPDYNSGWSVQVDTNGLIDAQHDYLFYEALLTSEWNTEKGWILDGGNLEEQLRALLTQYGFITREIDDFIEYWIPVIGGSAWYAVYPQDATEILSLNISPKPDSLLQGHFVIRALDHPVPLQAPEVRPFIRTGFTVAEWGVWGWNE